MKQNNKKLHQFVRSKSVKSAPTQSLHKLGNAFNVEFGKPFKEFYKASTSALQLSFATKMKEFENLLSTETLPWKSTSIPLHSFNYKKHLEIEAKDNINLNNFFCSFSPKLHFNPGNGFR